MNAPRYPSKYTSSKYTPRKTYTRKTSVAPRAQAPKTTYKRQTRRVAPKSNSGLVKSFSRLGGGALGGYLGGPAGASVGSVLGSKAADLFTSLTGVGDYTVHYNTVSNPNQTPIFKNKGRSVFVTNREYITDVISSDTPSQFKIDSFDLNPADPLTYPWLATLAQNFEEYRIHGMVFHYKSNSADALNSVNTALGTVVMATQYNILLDPFRNKQEMENYEFGCSGRPSIDILHPIECDATLTSFGPIFNVRHGSNDKGDARLYSPGRFSIATVGQQGSAVNIGELWVSYEIEFFKPRMGDVTLQCSQYRGVGPYTANVYPFSEGEPYRSPSSDFQAVSIRNNTFYFDPGFTGKVQITIIWRCPVDLAGPIQPPTEIQVAGGCSLLPILAGPNATYGDGPLTNTTAMIYQVYLDIVSGGSASLIDGTFDGLATRSRCDILISTLPSTLEVFEDYIVPE